MAGVSMRIEPAHVCRRARALVLDGDHMGAVKMLGDSYEGMDIDTAFSILDGTHTLERDGTGGARLVPDRGEGPEHRELLAEAYGHRVRIEGRWHEPYAVVRDVSKRDWCLPDGLSAAARERAWKAWAATTAAVRGLDPERTEQAEFESLAPLHYSDDPAGDRVAYLKVGSYFDGGLRPRAYMREMGCPVLFRSCDAPPPWMKGAASPLEAVRLGIAALHVEGRGHRIRSGIPSIDSDVPDPFGREEAEARIARLLEEAVRNPVQDGRSPARRAAESVLDEPRSPRHEAEARRAVPGLREAILDQARRSGGFMQVDLGSGPVPVPRAPFERWALRPVRMEHLAPDWRSVSPPDLKLAQDSQDHSDWMIGAGLDPFDWHGHGEGRLRLREAGYEAMYALQESRAKVGHAVLAGSGAASGPVWIARRGELPPLGAVVVLPDASPAWVPAVQAAIGRPGVGAVIVEQGGAMAHLVTVLREGGAPVIRWPGARKALAGVSDVRVDCSDGSVEILGHADEASQAPHADEAAPAPGI